MFPLSELYNLNMQRVNHYHWLHAAGMCDVARFTGSLNLNNVKGALGYDTMVHQDMGVRKVNSMIVAKDDWGATIALASSTDRMLDAWKACMATPLVTHAAFAGKTFQWIKDEAAAFFAALPALCDLTGPVLVVGQGMAGAVAAVLESLIRVGNVNATRSMQIAGLKFATQDAAPDFDGQTASWIALDDQWCYAPPAAVQNLGSGSQGTLDPLFHMGEYYQEPRTARSPVLSLERMVVNGNARTWLDLDPQYTHQAVHINKLETTWYPRRIWNVLTPNQQNRVLPWLAILRDDLSYSITRRTA